jgi:hypothetical protein
MILNMRSSDAISEKAMAPKKYQRPAVKVLNQEEARQFLLRQSSSGNAAAEDILNLTPEKSASG